MTTGFRRPLHAIAAVLVAAVMIAGCSSTSSKSGSTSRPGAAVTRLSTPRPAATLANGVPRATHGSTVATAGSYAVGSLSETYVDRRRPTKKNGSAPAKAERTLPTLILYPASGSPGFEKSIKGATPQPGPWPLVVFSHGVTGNGPVYSVTLRVLASAGYIVVAPDYPLSKGNAEGGPSITDVAEQTRDITFLIDRVLAASKGSGGPLAGLVDASRIGIAGHSLGAITSLGAGYNACCADPRIKAVAEWAGIFFPLESNGKVDPASQGRPLLMAHGTADQTVNYRFGQAVYKLLGAPKYFITLPGAGHIPPYLFGTRTPQARVVTLATIDFFDRYLKGDDAGIARLRKVVADAGPAAATIEESAG